MGMHGSTSFGDAIRLMSTPGEEMTVVSNSTSTSVRSIDVMRDVTFKGKFSMSVCLHGNINVTFDTAEVMNTTLGNSAIYIAKDFIGTLTIKDSIIRFRAIEGARDGVAISTESFDSTFDVLKVINSTIDGVMSVSDRCQMFGEVRINTRGNETDGYTTVVLARHFDASQATIINDGFATYFASIQSGNLQKMKVLSGPAEFDGSWNIDNFEIDIVSPRFEEKSDVIRFPILNSDHISDVTITKGINVINAPADDTIVNASNVNLTFSGGIVGSLDRPYEYKGILENSTVKNDGAEENLNWTIIGSNVYVDNAERQTGLSKVAELYPNSLKLVTLENYLNAQENVEEDIADASDGDQQGVQDDNFEDVESFDDFSDEDSFDTASDENIYDDYPDESDVEIEAELNRRIKAWGDSFTIDKNLMHIKEVITLVNRLDDEYDRIFWYKQGYQLMTSHLLDESVHEDVPPFYVVKIFPYMAKTVANLHRAQERNDQERIRLESAHYQDVQYFLKWADQHKTAERLDNIIIIHSDYPFRSFREEFTSEQWHKIYLEYQEYMLSEAGYYHDLSGYGGNE